MYNINFTDKSKTALVIQPGEINYDTSLILFGKNTPDWGKLVNSNFIKLLEHFSNEYSPGYSGNVLEGQLWFDTNTNQLKVCIDNASLIWKILCNTQEPDLTDVVTYDNLNNYISNYIQLSGDTLTGPLLVSHPINNFDIANKHYVNTRACLCVDNKSKYDGYISINGGVVGTRILLSAAGDNAAVPKSYVDSIASFEVSPTTKSSVEGNATLLQHESTIIHSSDAKIMVIHGSGFFAKKQILANFKFSTPIKTNYHVAIGGFNIQPNNSITSPSHDYPDIFISDISSSGFNINRIIDDFDMTFYFTIFGYPE